MNMGKNEETKEYLKLETKKKKVKESKEVKYMLNNKKKRIMLKKEDTKSKKTITNNNEKEKGITLVALVITIVVLIILSTITIGAIFGDEGLINSAERAKELAEKAVKDENNKMNILMQEYANAMAEDGEITPPEVDNILPTVSIVVGEITENSIEVTVNATDNESGLATSGTYKYYLNGEEKATIESNSYKYTGLTAGMQYTIKVEVFDKAGNKGENSTTVSTEQNYPTIEETLKEGAYVYYKDGTDVTRKCVVLYGPENAKYSSYGIQIIPMECVEDLTLGQEGDNNTTKFNANRELYNDVINYLNNATQKYLNTTYAKSVRCVGSVPDNPSYDVAGMFNSSYSYMSSYNGTFKDTDENYKTDLNQMQALNNINNINKTYWLASRDVISYSSGSYFRVRRVISNGSLSNDTLCHVRSRGDFIAYSYSYGLRPVFTLKSEIKVIGGDGSSTTPYELGV